MRALLLALLVAGSPPAAPPRVVDAFDDVAAWRATASDGVGANVVSGPGCQGRGLRLDYDFRGGSGYAIARRALRIPLPASWAFRFCLKAEGATNDLEVKLLDATGDNVWWWRRKGLAPSGAFERVVVKKRHVSFAWGPAGGGDLKEMFALELAVVAGAGGKGSLFLDELTFEELPVPGPPRAPSATASSSARGFDAARALDGDAGTAWRSVSSAPGGRGPEWLRIDLGGERELGGVVVTFEPGRHARDLALEASDDGATWRTLRQVSGNGRTVSWLPFPETDARFLRLAFEGGVGVAEIELKPPSFSESPDTLAAELAKRAPAGRYPRGFAGQQTYWTAAGVDGDPEEVLVGEDGALEPGKGTFSLEPFLLSRGAFLDWAHVTISHGLADGFLPIPTVKWTAPGVELAITALVDGPAGGSTLRARYRVRNTGSAPLSARLLVAIRPFLVNPPSQFLNAPHGVSRIDSLAWDGKAVSVGGAKRVVPVTTPSAFGATTFDAAELVDVLAAGKLPAEPAVTDPTGLASGAFAWDLDLPSGGHRDVIVTVPLGAGAAPDGGAAPFEERLAAATKAWTAALTRVGFRVPPAAGPLVETLRSNLAYVLINRDGPRIQPGSRAYERSWIRDGALTSSALLRLGHATEARDFLVWFAGHQFANGKVPCCVDARGADPVPENDSHGELLFLAGEYLRLTGDRKTVEALWPRLAAAVGYIDLLRKQRLTAEYESGEKRLYRGLLPESISHEGYSDHPVHSYWDDFFALKGLKDAVSLAHALGRTAEEAAWTPIRDAFGTDLHASLRGTIAAHGLDTLPASVERFDFDPTSTTAMLSPGGELANLPARELSRTFERYVAEARERRDGTRKSEAYTPYELRSVGALVRLGKKAEAHEMLDFFMKDRRPAAWNQWAEVVGADPRAPRFLGDMPHTWVGTDFIRSFLDFFVYEREADEALVLGAGLPASWLRAPGGVGVTGIVTPYGRLDLQVSAAGDEVRARIDLIGGSGIPRGGIALAWPLDGAAREATVNGKPVAVRGGEVLVREVPADVVVRR